MICANKTHFLARKLHVGRDFPTSGEARANYFPLFSLFRTIFLCSYQNTDWRIWKLRTMLSCLRFCNVGTLKGIDLYPSFSFIFSKAEVVLIQIYFILLVFKVPLRNWLSRRICQWTIYLLENSSGAGEVTVVCGHLPPSLTPGTDVRALVFKGENWLSRAFLCPPHMCCGMCIYVHTHAHTCSLHGWKEPRVWGPRAMRIGLLYTTRWQWAVFSADSRT